VDVLVTNLISAAKQVNSTKVALAGGVAANSQLRKQLKLQAAKEGFEVYYPSPILCTDNAAMIACAAHYEFGRGNVSDLNLNAIPGLKLGERI
jgi:N6-L-threonylcarbamoyladenine synthase